MDGSRQGWWWGLRDWNVSLALQGSHPPERCRTAQSLLINHCQGCPGPPPDPRPPPKPAPRFLLAALPRVAARFMQMSDTWLKCIQEHVVLAGEAGLISPLISLTAFVAIVLGAVLQHELYVGHKLLLGNVLPFRELLLDRGQVHWSLKESEKIQSEKPCGIWLHSNFDRLVFYYLDNLVVVGGVRFVDGLQERPGIFMGF